MKERLYLRTFLVIPSLFVLYFVFQIFRPFLLPITLAVILVSICYPGYEMMSRLLKGRSSAAAFLTCLVVVLLLVVPFVLLSLSLAKEVSHVYLEFQKRFEGGEFRDVIQQLGPYFQTPVAWVSGYIDLQGIDVLKSLGGVLQQASVFFLKHSTTILSGFAGLVSKFFIMLVTMFFLFRDGARLLQEFKALTPLSSNYEGILVGKLREVTRAVVLGSLLTALAQGFAGGIVFWMLGVSNLLFWSTLMALFSLVPVVGTSIIWVPWAIYFLFTGSFVKAIVLVLLAVFFVGMIDNILRPLFIEGKAGMHTLLVFFSIMGGIAYFGMIGMIFGPIIVSLGLTFLELYKLEFRQELIKPGQ